MKTGLVFDVKRFALHDGDGLRTTAFLKGCPLACPWCQNPEGIDRNIQLRWTPSRCIRCGTCVAACPRAAAAASDPGHHISIDHDRCNGCGVCLDECPTGALRFNGRRVSAADLAADLLRDRGFFADDGGITLSGGEPLAQPVFAAEALRLCRAAGVHTAVETALAVPRTAIDAVLPHVDQFLVDLKLADPDAHRDIVVAGGHHVRGGNPDARLSKGDVPAGVELATIRDNLEYLVSAARSARPSAPTVLIRIPTIPGFTATRENLRALGEYIATLRPEPPVELVNFNPLAESKYRLSGRTWPVPTGTPGFGTEEMACLAKWVREGGADRVVG